MYPKFKATRYALLVLMVSIISFPLHGEKYPRFTLEGTDGKQYHQNQFIDKEFVCIILYSNHCKISQSFEGLIKDEEMTYEVIDYDEIDARENEKNKKQQASEQKG